MKQNESIFGCCNQHGSHRSSRIAKLLESSFSFQSFIFWQDFFAKKICANILDIESGNNTNKESGAHY